MLASVAVLLRSARMAPSAPQRLMVCRAFCSATTSTATTPAATPAAPEATSALGVIPEIPENYKTKVREAVAYLKNVNASSRKLNEMCYLVRRLNTSEALAQMQFSRSQKFSVIMQQCIKSAVRNATHNFNMDANRLVIVRADVARGTPLKRIKIHAKGRYGRMERPRTHLRVVVREVPRQPDEERLGLRGHKHATKEGKGRANGRKQKWLRRRRQYAEMNKMFGNDHRIPGSPVATYLSAVADRTNNERGWLEVMNLKYPPTRKTHHDPSSRRFKAGARPLQPNGGPASLTGKGERTALKRAVSSTDESLKHVWGGMSAALVNRIKAKIDAKAVQDKPADAKQ